MFRNQYGWLLDLALSFAFLGACFNVGLTLPAASLPVSADQDVLT